ncbi:cyclic nucleotide-binding domain-containing protein [Photobacterium phosphoreum]|uniref:cyclic nucleotide-binding domain-containing protein n=1 Tax=Photobacterium phosphoreum TaxID=659 RepID=UPI002159398F|nr:cyclic nucleotide-binding domain-containing protein [Photobacterium phosphoreum]
MQLKPLQKGRYQQSWADEYSKIEKIVLACISEKRFVNEGQLLIQQGQQLGSLVLVKQGRIALKYSTRSGRNFQLGSIYCDHQIFGEMEFFLITVVRWMSSHLKHWKYGSLIVTSSNKHLIKTRN